MIEYPTQEQLVASLAGAMQAQIDRANRAEAEAARLRTEVSLMTAALENDKLNLDNCDDRLSEARAEADRLRATIRNVRRNLELHAADDWQDSYRLVAIAVLSDALETEV